MSPLSRTAQLDEAREALKEMRVIARDFHNGKLDRIEYDGETITYETLKGYMDDALDCIAWHEG